MIVIPEDVDIERFQSSAGKLVEIEVTRELVESGKNLIKSKSQEVNEYRKTGYGIYREIEPPERIMWILEAALATEEALKNLYKACSEMNLEGVDDSSIEDVHEAYDEAMCDITMCDMKEAARYVYVEACDLEPNSSHHSY